METDLKKFASRRPYASELFGVFQPILGWKSSLTKGRVASIPADIPGLDLPTRVTRGDGEFRASFGQDYDAVVNIDGVLTAQNGRPDLFELTARTANVRLPAHVDGLILRSLAPQLRALVVQHPPNDLPFWRDFWTDTLNRKSLNTIFQKAIDQISGAPLFAPHVPTDPSPIEHYVLTTRAKFTSIEDTLRYLLNHEVQAARFLNSLLPDSSQSASALHFPDDVNALLLDGVTPRTLKESLDELSVMALATGSARTALFSPLGILHLFRQYFFEFDSFLGPSVEHVWLSPGSTTELIETSSRRVLEEHLLEQITEALFKAETSSTNQEELSKAIKEENSKNTKMGASISGGATILIAHAEASGTTSLDETAKSARELNHKEMRQQSTKLSSEIRTNFKSSFKTTTESTDTRSKRYVIENKGDSLVNYELRRKMRQVGVQMQDVGTHLCWQVYVDDPGREIGVGQLVHLAAKSDLSQFAHLPTKNVPSANGVIETVTILLPVPRPGERSNLGPIAAAGFIGLMAGSVPGVIAGVAAYEVLDSLFGDDDDEHEWYSIDAPKTIHQTYKLTIPDGYQLADSAGQASAADEQFVLSATGQIPLRWLGKNGAKLSFHMNVLNPADGTMDLVVNGGDVTPGEIIEFQARIRVVPTAVSVQAANEYNAGVLLENKKRDTEKDRKIKEDLINAVKQRVELASGIQARPAVDLREEERTVVYRSLISQLMRDAWSVGVDRKVAHLRSELIKAIFDVDKMLYFVAPEWWQPRLHTSKLEVGVEREPSERVINSVSAGAISAAGAMSSRLRTKATSEKLGTLGSNDIVGWGGEGRSDNYLITDKSKTARLGSSLGWLLQLDGDNLRNAFLNAPWVKAVIPIRAGREREALEWLKQSRVEGSDGLESTYDGSDKVSFAERKLDLTGDNTPPTNGEVLDMLAADVTAKYRESLTVKTDAGINGDEPASYLPTEEVFEKGFSPLKGGFRAFDTARFKVYDQWVEIMPTDQIVAVKVSYDPITGKML